MNMQLVGRLGSRALLLLTLLVLVLPAGGPAVADGAFHECPESGPCCFHYCPPSGGGSPTCWCYYTTTCAWIDGEYHCNTVVHCGAGCT